MPSGITTAQIELETAPVRLASPYTPGDIVETHYFIKGTEPTEVSQRYSQLSDVTNLLVVEDKSSATLSWTSPKTPDVINPEWLKTYFNNGYGQFAEKYYNRRLEYNTNAIGDFGFDIYLARGNDLTYVGWTKDNEYTIDDTTGYDSVVVKSAYSIFKANASNGVTNSLTGSSTSFEIELEGVENENGVIYVNPTYSIGSTLPDLGLNTIKFLVNKIDITDTIKDKSYKIQDCTSACTQVDKIDSSKKGIYEITYYVTYLGNTYDKTRTVTIK